MVKIKCYMCGELYERPAYKPCQMEPDPEIPNCKIGTIPEFYQSQISHNLQCPNRPGGTYFWNWFKWKIRQFFKTGE